MSTYGKRNINEPMPSMYGKPYGHGSLNRGPDPWTAIPNTTDTTLDHRRRARAYMQTAVGRGLITADELAAYLPMIFSDADLEEMGA